MPQRVVGIVTVAAGLLVVAALVIIGVDVRAAAKRGPRWKRRLLGAGLAVLGLVGATQHGCTTTTCYVQIAIDSAATPASERLKQQMCVLLQLTSEDKLDPEVARKALAAAEAALAEASKGALLEKLSSEERLQLEQVRLATRMKAECIRARLEGGPRPLSDSADWQTLAAVLDEARAVVEDRSGGYVFDESGKARLLEKMDSSVGTVDRLVQAGCVTDGEGMLLKKNLSGLKFKVEAQAPLEARSFTCYISMPLPDEALYPEVRLRARLPLLEKLAAEEQLDPSVVRKVIATVEDDLAEIEADPEAAETRDAVKAQLEKLKKLAGKAPP